MPARWIQRPVLIFSLVAVSCDCYQWLELVHLSANEKKRGKSKKSKRRLGKTKGNLGARFRSFLLADKFIFCRCWTSTLDLYRLNQIFKSVVRLVVTEKQCSPLLTSCGGAKAFRSLVCPYHCSV